MNMVSCHYGDVPKFFLTKGKNKLKNWTQSCGVWMKQGYINKGLLLVVGKQQGYVNRGLLMLSHEYGIVSL